jgi:S-adenosylmethionine decarboxylase
MYGEPIIFSPGGIGKEENQGYDAFVPLIDSGISVYIWSNAKFFSAVIYTCKGFDEKIAVEVTKKFFKIDEIVWCSF